MARFKDREKALALRKQGKSYSQIKKILGLSKSTLSVWLRNYPLSKQRIQELRDWNEQRIEKYRETMRKKRQARLDKTYDEQKKIILPLTKREFFIAGLMLYWGEGEKARLQCVGVSNTDPSVIKFFIRWATQSLWSQKHKIRIQIHLYNDMNIKKEMNYWSRTLNIPLKQFNRPYIKNTSSERINHKGSFGHGTCNARISDVLLAEKIIMGLKTISDEYTK
jgi:transposase